MLRAASTFLVSLACVTAVPADILAQPAFDAGGREHAIDGPLWLAAAGLFLLLIVAGIRLKSGMAQLASTVSELSQKDATTGLWLGHAFLPKLAEALRKEPHNGRRAICWMVELDDIASLNESYGVAAIDELLVAIARHVERRVTDSGGFCCRWSGHRLAAWIRAQDMGEARRSLKHMQTELQQLDIHLAGMPVRFRVSLAFLALPGSRLEDVQNGFAQLGETLNKATGAAGKLVEAEVTQRTKRTFRRDEASSLVRQE